MEQPVDRLVAACASEPIGIETGRNGVPPSVNRFAQALLPVRSARELLLGLCRNWRIWSGADTALVKVQFIDCGRALVARACEGELPQVAECAVKPTEPAEDFHEFEAASQIDGTDCRPAAAVLPLPIATEATACVILYSSSEIDLDDELRDQLCDWSGLLIDQATWVERGQADRKILENQKAEALAEFAAGAGHEINNPLATIAGRVQILLRDETDGDRRQSLATIGAQALRVRDMIGDLMLFGRPPAAVPRRLVLNELIESTVGRFVEAARSISCRLSLRPSGTVFATADPNQMSVVIGELLRNALNALAETTDSARGQIPAEELPAKEILIAFERTTIHAKPGALVSVTDNGPGLNEKDRAHLFDPYYSGRNAGRGLGFGLCKCWRLVTNHGGWIEVESVPHVATTFRTFWPDAAFSGEC